MTRIMMTAALVLLPTLSHGTQIGTAITTLSDGEITEAMADTATQSCAGSLWMAVAELGTDGAVQAASVEIVCLDDA